jgi:serine/threonine protein kinase
VYVQASDADYRIESLLGWGGMSVAYLAEDLRLKRRVALKLLAAGLARDESFCERFLGDSELAASIDHPNIVPIYEAGAIEDLLFIAVGYDARPERHPLPHRRHARSRARQKVARYLRKHYFQPVN